MHKRAAAQLGLTVHYFDFRKPEEIGAALTPISASGIKTMLYTGDPIMRTRTAEIMAFPLPRLADSHTIRRMPSVSTIEQRATSPARPSNRSERHLCGVEHPIASRFAAGAFGSGAPLGWMDKLTVALCGRLPSTFPSAHVPELDRHPPFDREVSMAGSQSIRPRIVGAMEGAGR